MESCSDLAFPLVSVTSQAVLMPPSVSLARSNAGRKFTARRTKSVGAGTGVSPNTDTKRKQQNSWSSLNLARCWEACVGNHQDGTTALEQLSHPLKNPLKHECKTKTTWHGVMEMAQAKSIYKGTPYIGLYVAQILVVCVIQKLAQSLSLFSLFYYRVKKSGFLSSPLVPKHNFLLLHSATEFLIFPLWKMSGASAGCWFLL